MWRQSSSEEEENEITSYEYETYSSDTETNEVAGHTDDTNIGTAQNRGDWGDTSNSSSNFKKFTENSFLGPAIDITNIKSLIDMFQYFLNNDILDIIVTETNRYAAQQIS